LVTRGCCTFLFRFGEPANELHASKLQNCCTTVTLLVPTTVANTVENVCALNTEHVVQVVMVRV